MDIGYYAILFCLGGTLVTLTTCFSKLGRPRLAAIITILPMITTISILATASGGDTKAAGELAFNILLMLPVWAVYAATVWQLMRRMSAPLAVAIAISLYMGLGLAERAIR